MRGNLKARLLLSWLALLMLVTIGTAQEGRPLQGYLADVADSENKEFIYRGEWLTGMTVAESAKNKDFLAHLQHAIKESGLQILSYQNHYVFIYPNEIEYERLKRQHKVFQRNDAFVESIRIGNPDESNFSIKYVLSGRITNEQGDPIVGATVVEQASGAGAVSDKTGEYFILLRPGNYELRYSYVGLVEEVRRITLYGTGELDISLFQNVSLLDEVIVEESSPRELLQQNTIGVSQLGIATLETMPALFGEPDVLKSAAMIPGVNISGESSAYLNVRGGRNDQTLVLMNNAPVFNPGHILGFFSVFNDDFVSGFSLYKGNIPSRFGTRASSVMDVKMHRKARSKTNYYGGIGVIKSNLGIKTKMLDDKLDLHIGGRASYSSGLFKWIEEDEDIFNSAGRFGDFNMSSSYAPNDKNTINASLFGSGDYFNYSDEIIYKWNSLIGTAEWNRLTEKGLLLTHQMTFSQLWNSSEGLETNDEFLLKNGIANVALNNSILLDVGPGTLDGGIQMSSYNIRPGEISPLGNSSLVQRQMIDEEQIWDLAAYADYSFEVTDIITVNPGVRFVRFMNRGPGQSLTYAPDGPRDATTVIGVEDHGNGDLLADFYRIEPRVGVNFGWEDRSVKIGYSRTNQFLHLVSNTALINPVSVWKASDQFIEPTRIDQFSAGYYQNIFDSKATVSVEGYYKRMRNLVDYKDGAELVLNENLEQVILAGEGEAYGIELLLSKPRGEFKGWASYTFSRAFIETDGDHASETINGGDRYPYYSDRPHNVQIYFDYKLTKKWTLSSNFVYSSGAPTSAPQNIVQIDGVTVPYFPERNTERVPDYHRLDLSITWKTRIRKNKRNNDRLVLSFYNVYSRRNASTVFFRRQEPDTATPSPADLNVPSRPFQLISIGSIIPTITYKFEF